MASVDDVEAKDSYIFSPEDIFGHDEDNDVKQEPDDGYEEPDDVGEGPSGDEPLVYDGGDELRGIPTRGDLVEKHCPEIHAKINSHIKEGKLVFFMPHDVEESNDYVRGA